MNNSTIVDAAIQSINIDISQPDLLATIFANEKIRVVGTIDAPLFCAADIAKYIGDTHYRRLLPTYGDIYKSDVVFVDTMKRPQKHIVLTELGLYKYLLQSKLPGAEEFQNWVFNSLVEIRKKIVDDIRLAARIAVDKLKLCMQESTRFKEEIARRSSDIGEYTIEVGSCHIDYMNHCIRRYKRKFPLQSYCDISPKEWREIENMASRYFNKREVAEGYRAIAAYLYFLLDY